VRVADARLRIGIEVTAIYSAKAELVAIGVVKFTVVDEESISGVIRRSLDLTVGRRS
jgi:hypothetical protein